MKHSILSYFLCYTCLLFACVFSAHSTASNRYYADNTLEPIQGFAWDWSAGTGYYIEDSYLIGMDSYDDGIELNLSLAVSFDNFYLDYDHNQLSGGLVIGYSLINKYNWELDIIGANAQAGFGQKGLGFYNNGVVEELRGIKKRKYDFNTGLRFTHRFDGSQVSIEFLHDISNAHNGWVFNSFFSKIQPWRNWEFRSGIGFSAYSADFTNYYFGIEQSEVTLLRPAYKTNASSSIMLEFHAEYPLNQDWVFLAGWLTTLFSKEIDDSPIISQGYQHKAKLGVRYVF